MPRKKRPGPSLRAQWLGKQLRSRREANGITLDQAGEYLQRNPSMVSRFESAEYPIRRGDVMALLDFYGVSSERDRSALLGLSEDMWRKGWWDDYVDTLDYRLVDLPWLESRAEKICAYEAMMMPGLLQTPQYAEALIRAIEGPDAPDELVRRALELRMTRQKLLEGDTAPLEVVVDESVLRREVGSVEIMQGQLQHLREAGRKRSIEVRILPLTAGGHAGMDGAFHIFEMPDPYPDVAYIESLAGRCYVEEADRVERFQRTYDQLRKTALGPRKSAELISAALEDGRDSPDCTND